MKDRISIVRLLFCASVVWISGCSNNIAGAWQTTEISPQGAAFPINQVSFDAQGHYTATGVFSAQGGYSGDTHTTTGAYTKKRQVVCVSPVGGPPLEYKIRRRLDGKLVMTLLAPGQKGEVTAVLTPATP